MRVRVELFGRAAEQAGVRTVELDLPANATSATAAEALAERYPRLEWLRRGSRPARNQEYARWEDPLAEGDEVSFIPPVSGG
ncbi:MAG: MoaD/ThiS family protein [Armatimonadetes bacterium]|nr:MoaD/ThiS family protein [Armatimonadota bacterium]